MKFWRGRGPSDDGAGGEGETDLVALAAEKVREGSGLEERGDLAGAEAAYREADALGSGEGASNLGVLLFERGSVQEAEEVLRRSDERGHPMGTFRLGFLLDSQGDAEGCEQAYRRAAERGSLLAAGNLAFLFRERGDRESAIDFYEYLMRSGDPEQVRMGRDGLVRMGLAPKPRPVPPPGFDPERSLLDSTLWLGGDPADERVRRAREFVFRETFEGITAEEAPKVATMWLAFEEPGKAEAILRRGADLGSAQAAADLSALLSARD